jgi:MerR family copper efflux transcriptional regulator
MAIYMIGDLTRITGLSKHTLNYYLNIGLISPVGQSERSHYRYFDESTIEKLGKIVEMRKQKISIRQIKQQFAKEL